MTQVYILAGAGIALLVAGIIVGKIGSNKCKTALIALGFVLGFTGVVTGFFGYETYIMQPVEYSITNCREVEGGYKLTLEGSMKGFTGGTVFVTTEEAKSLNLMECDEDGNWKWIGGRINQNRNWVSDHRDN